MDQRQRVLGHRLPEHQAPGRDQEGRPDRVRAFAGSSLPLLPLTLTHPTNLGSIQIANAAPQLNERYFKGLEGQYAFDLHFLLQEAGAEASDHIVRARGA